jgi:RND family efflux transporter MFP subunit
MLRPFLHLFVFSGLLLPLYGKDGPPKGPPPSPVKVGKVESGSIQNRKVVTGQLVSKARSLLSPQMSGTILKILVDEGGRVKKGDLLLKLDSRRLEQDLLINLQHQKVLNSRIKAVSALVSLQKEEFDEIEKALKSFPGSISQKEKRQAQMNLTQGQGDLSTLQAEVEGLKAQRQRLSIDLQDHELKAPFDGIIFDKTVEIGAKVLTGQPVFTLLDPNNLQVELDCPESMADIDPAVLKDSRVVLNLNETNLELKNYRFQPRLDPSSKTFKILADLVSIPSGAIDGASVVGEVALGANSNRTWLPADAVLKNDVGPYVYKVQPGPMGNMALPMPIQILYRAGNRVVIAPGPLVQGDQVVTEGNERLFPMTPIRILEAKL